MKKVILASASPRRRQLLQQIGLAFEVLASNIEEVLDKEVSPREQVEVLSRQKALATAELYAAEDAIIIAADTMVVKDDEVLGKPKNENDAAEMLRKLSGKSHQIITGFTLLDKTTNKQITDSSVTTIWFREIADEEIKKFIKTEEPYDKAGAYGIQEKAAIFMEKLEGDYSGAVGLPLFLVAKHLQEFGIKVL